MDVSPEFAADTLRFFAGRPAALALFGALARRLDAALPDTAARVQKTQITFVHRRVFAMASLPRRKGEEGLVLSFGLGRRLDSPRIGAAVEPYPGRWTHHMALTDAAQLDGELLAWLREAWAFAAAK